MSSLDATTPQLKVVKNFIEAYRTSSVKNIEPLISKDFKYLSFPTIPEHPDEEKEAHLERYAPLFSLVTKLEITYHEVIEAPGKVIIHASAVIHTVDGNELAKEGLAIITIVEEGGELKIIEFKEFIDPEQRSKLFSWGANALAKGVSAV